MLEARCPPTLGSLSEPAGDLRDSRHLLKLFRKTNGRAHRRDDHALDTFVSSRPTQRKRRECVTAGKAEVQ